MGSLLRMLSSGSGGVQEDALLAVGTLIEGGLRIFSIQVELMNLHCVMIHISCYID